MAYVRLLRRPGFLVRFGLVLAAMFCNGAFWASGRPRLQDIASLLLGTFAILLILMVINHGWIAGLPALVGGSVSAAVGGLTVGHRLRARSSESPASAISQRPVGPQ